MPKFQLLSDLHLESAKNFQSKILPTLKTDADYLILAGDICEARNFERFSWFFKWCMMNYQETYMVMGNHEFYNSDKNTHFFELQYSANIGQNILYRNNIDRVSYLLQDHIDHLKSNLEDEYEKNYVDFYVGNFTILKDFEPLIVELPDENTIILGDTTWTNYHNGNPFVMMDCNHMMNDKKAAGLTAQECYNRHVEVIDSLKKILDKHKDKKIILVTHHPITQDYLEYSRFKGDKLNGGFSSNYNQLILDNPQIKVVASGHIHEKFIGKIGKTDYYINPLGYPGEVKDKQYIPLTFEI
jgi:predicted phosphodiesterase